MAVTRSREANPLSWYKTILLSLQQLYTRLLEDTVVLDQSSPEWVDIKVCSASPPPPPSFTPLL